MILCNDARMRRATTKQLLRTMKLTAIIIFSACLVASANGKAQTITLSVKNAPLEKVFESITKQTGFTFLYKDKVIEKAEPVNLDVTNVPLESVLQSCFKNQPLSYKIFDKTIVIGEKNSSPSVEGDASTAPSTPPPIDVHGKVVNEKGEPVTGVSIKIKGTNSGTTTDASGEFILKNVDEKAVLVFSATNIEGFEIKINGRTELNTLSAKTKVSPMDEVQVQAYGTVTKRYNVGSITTVKAEDIEKQPVSNPLQALEGRVPGLVVSQTSGVPGASLHIQIRGQNSLKPGTSSGSVAAGSTIFDNPLFIIDGVPFAPQNANINQYRSLVSPSSSTVLGSQGLSPFNSINPFDIESIEILRGADATAIYGSRGANGVVLITTKKGKAGQARFTGNVWTAESQVAHTMPLMNTKEYIAMRNEAFRNDGIIPNNQLYDPGFAPDLTVFDTTKYTDWKKYFIGGTAHTIDANSSLSGGNENTQFLVGAGYHHETYIYPGDFADNRASVNANIHHTSLDKRLMMDLSTYYTYEKNNSSAAPRLLAAFTLPPNYPDLINQDGTLNWSYNGIDIGDEYYVGGNPLSYLKQLYSAKSYLLNSHFQIDYNILPGLTLRSSLGYTTFNGDEYYAYPKASQDPAGGYAAFAHFGTNDFQTWIIEPQGEYKKQLGNGKLDALVGTSFQQNINRSTDISAGNYSNDLLLGSVTAAGTTSATNGYSLYKYNAVFGRINYIYENKYILNVTGRRDGSSRFGPGKQFGNFGSAGLGWIFSEETFMKKISRWLDYGKLRATYGTTGNDNIGNYQYLSAYMPIGNASYQGSVGYNPQSLYNPDFSWSVTKKFEAGMELSFFKNRLLANLTWFQNKSGNQLVAYRLPSQTGFTNVNRNAPYTVQNKGWEIELTSTNIKTKQFEWSSSFQITIPRNVLLSFPGITTSSYNSIYVVGQSLSVLKEYIFLGVNDTTGMFQYDSKTDKYNPSFTNDLHVIGNLDPKFYGGLGNKIRYKQFELDIFLQFTKQIGANYLQQVYNSSYQPGGIANLPSTFLSRWQKPGDHAELQQLTTQYGNVYSSGSYFFTSSGAYSDASFIRCKNIALAYQISTKYLQKLKLQGFQVYLNAQNLFTITRYKGNDPENQNFYSLPPLRTIAMGLKFNF